MKKLKFVYLILFFLFLTSNYLPWVIFEGYEVISPKNESHLRKYGYAIFYIITFIYILYFLFIKEIKILSIPKSEIYKMIIPSIFLFYCFLTVFWSNDIQFSLRRYIAFLGTTLAGIALYYTFNLDYFLKYSQEIIYFFILTNVVIIFAYPELGIHQKAFNQNWRGMFHHKNPFGRVSFFFLTIMFFSQRKRGLPKKFGFYLSSSILVLFIIKSGSKTALFLMFLVPLTVAFLYIYEYSSILSILVVFILVTLSSMIISNFYYSLITMIGENASLSGRTHIYEAVWRFIQDKPIFGYGFESFWNSVVGNNYNNFWTRPWIPSSSHNGFLELWLNTGIIGVLVFLTTFLLLIKNAIIYSMIGLKNKQKKYIWPLVFLTYYTFANFVQTHLIQRNHFHWALIIFLYFYLSKVYVTSDSKGMSP